VPSVPVPLTVSPIDESLIAEHLKQDVIHGDERETSGGSTVEFELAAEDCIRRNCARGKGGWAAKELHKKASLVANIDTGEKMYQTVAELFDIPLPELRIWNTYSQFTPWQVVERSETPISKTDYLQQLVQRKPADEPVPVGYEECVYFMKFFDHRIPQPLQYLGTHLAGRRKPVSLLFPIVADRLGFPADTTFLAFEETSTIVRKADPMYNSYPAASLIFQLEVGTPLPETSHEWEVQRVAVGLPTKSYETEAVETVDIFLKNTIEAVVLRCEAPETPVCRITFPATVTLSEFKTFVASAIDVPYDPATSAMAIYKKDRVENKPDTTPIREYPNDGLVFEFSANAASEYRIWVQIDPEISEAVAATRQAVIVEYQESADVLPKSQRILSPKDSYVDDFLSHIVQAQIITDMNVKVYCLYDHKIDRQLSTHDRIYSTYTTVFIAKPSVLALSEQEHLLKAAHVVHETSLRAILSPFFVKAGDNEKISDFLARLKLMLQVDDAEYTKLRFMLGGQYPQYTPSAILKGEKTMGEAINAISTTTTTSVYLFVIHPGEKTTRTSGY
jgi:hypothetical protein